MIRCSAHLFLPAIGGHFILEKYDAWLNVIITTGGIFFAVFVVIIPVIVIGGRVCYRKTGKQIDCPDFWGFAALGAGAFLAVCTIDPMTFRLSFKHISGINYEDLEYLATDKSTLYIEPHFEDYEDDGLPMFDFVMEDGDTQDVISPNDPLELSQEIEAYIDDLDTTQRENHQLLMDEGYFGADPEFTADEDGWVWVTIKSVINRSEFRF